MPNTYGEPKTKDEARQMGLNWYCPAPKREMVMRYDTRTDSWKGSGRCQHTEAGTDKMCPNFVSGRGSKVCIRHGGAAIAERSQMAKAAEVERKDAILNKYAVGLPREVTEKLVNMAEDPQRTGLSDEVDVLRVLVGKIAQETMRDPEKASSPGAVKELSSLLRDIAVLLKTQSDIETSEQYLFTATNVKNLIARIKNAHRESLEKAYRGVEQECLANGEPVPVEVTDAFAKCHMYFEEMVRDSAKPRRTEAVNVAGLLEESPADDGDAIDGEFSAG